MHLCLVQLSCSTLARTRRHAAVDPAAHDLLMCAVPPSDSPQLLRDRPARGTGGQRSAGCPRVRYHPPPGPVVAGQGRVRWYWPGGTEVVPDLAFQYHLQYHLERARQRSITPHGLRHLR